eukprot:6771203-Prymnesium_polylepis.1
MASLGELSALRLRSGQLMPSVGLGTWKIPKDRTATVVHEALKLGYRHLDCACDYGNEAEVGAGIRRALDDGTLRSREELWVTSKLWCTYHGREHAPLALNRTLADLGLEYLDLYMIHFPIPLKFVPFETRYPPEWVHDPDAAEPKLEYSGVPMQETWGAMEAMHASGLARHIGVCNVMTSGLRDLLSYAKVPPAVLQVERHVYLQQPQLLRFCREHDIAVVGFSPLGSGSYVELGGATEADSPLTEPTVCAAAARLGVSPAQ